MTSFRAFDPRGAASLLGSRPMAGGTLLDRIVAEVASIRREIENG